jgi:cytochrome c peroxidase
MKRFIQYTAAGMMALIVGFTACKPDPSFEVTPPGPDISFNVPSGWPAPYYSFQQNTLTPAGFELGRKLFFDGRLARDNQTSCATCHQPAGAFAQFDHAVSHGVDDKLGVRNSPAIFNMNWHTSFFWDGGVNHLESQPIAPIENPVEMDETIPNIIAKLNADAKYKSMFKAAFGDEEVTSQRIFKAMAQFMGMLVSSNSKYDKYMRSEGGVTLTTAEQNGLQVYKQNCAACHKEPLFTDFSFRNNGLKPSVVNDSGRAHITRRAEDLYKFKVPSLRNLKYTYPYMHDGRAQTLEDVLNHYERNIHQSPTLDPLLQSGIVLTAQQRSDLLAFLNTLNDEEFVKDVRFKEVQ